MSRLVLFGTGDIADLAAFYFEHDSPHRVAAFTVDGAYLRESSFRGLPVVAFEELEAAFPPQDHQAFAALSYARMNRLRAEKCQELKAKGYSLCSYISSKATVWSDLNVGQHCFILEHNNIQPGVRIGSNVFLWSSNHIGHHATIEDHVFMASQVAVGGGAVIGAYSFVGGHAGIAQRVKVGQHCLVGANTFITRNTEDYSVYAVKGTPKSPVPSSRVWKL